MIFLILPLALIILAVFVAGMYFFLLTMAGLFHKQHPADSGGPANRFAVLIPAHNEEEMLPGLLEGLGRQEYPRRLFDLYVVADNCSDRTVEIARRAGAFVFERHDSVSIGKGFAVEWLLQRIRTIRRSYDAYVLLDADCTVSPNFLAVMDRSFEAGSRIVQGYYTVSNPFQSPISALRYMALTLKHYVRPRGRQALGLSCGLFGTGMAFRKDVLDSNNWDAFSLAEDIELFLRMTDLGIKVDFAPEAVVRSQMPLGLRDSTSQNLRWETGRVRLAGKYAPRFLLKGMIRRDARRLDAALEQLIPPLSLTMMLAFVVSALAVAFGGPWLAGLALTGTMALLAHIIIGMASARVPLRIYAALAHVPRFVVWKAWVYVTALRPVRRQWVRTERSQH